MVVAAFRLATGMTGAIVAIESLLLYLGTHWLAQEPSPWAIPKNDAFAVVDVAAGDSPRIRFLGKLILVLNSGPQRRQPYWDPSRSGERGAFVL